MGVGLLLGCSSVEGSEERLFEGGGEFVASLVTESYGVKIDRGVTEINHQAEIHHKGAAAAEVAANPIGHYSNRNPRHPVPRLL
jgi:hypothetical protein